MRQCPSYFVITFFWVIKLKVCIAGKNKIAVDALLHLISCGWKDKLLVCPNRTDTGESGWQPSLMRFAREFGIEVIPLEEAQSIKDLVFISLEFDRLVDPYLFRSNRLYNIHFSALPAYKGMYTAALPILHGVKTVGVTLHKIDEGIDTGPIIDQLLFDIPEEWSARDLYFAYMEKAFVLFLNTFDMLVSSDVVQATPQPAKGSTYFSKTSIDYGCLGVNLRDTAEGVVRQLRAFSFREYQVPKILGMEIGGWQILPEETRNKPGTEIARDENTVTIATIDYALCLYRFREWDWFGFPSDAINLDLDSQYIDARNPQGWTPLICAAYAGNALVCSHLLEAGADPNYSNLNGTTPLMYSLSGGGSYEVARCLLNHGANPSQLDFFGRGLKDYHPQAFSDLDLGSHLCCEP